MVAWNFHENTLILNKSKAHTQDNAYSNHQEPKMAYYRRNKNELLTLTGAVYTFVAYLTAFTLEILFIVDLAKRSSELINSTPTSTTVSAYSSNRSANLAPLLQDDDTTPLDRAKLALDSMQSHATLSCLAISILYFILFVASLVLIVGLIIRSTFMILTWMCIMTTLYLPEFGLIIYVSFYTWGLDTRNGLTEFIFYLFRAVLNVLFIHRAHKLFKDWNYDKNFFRLKSSASHFTGYDSPYFIGDSLTTTINPMFSTSTLNLNRYDQIRDFNESPGSNTIYSSDHYDPRAASNGRTSRQFSGDASSGKYRASSYGLDSLPTVKGFYLGNQQHKPSPPRNHQLRHQNSVSSINDSDSITDYELDLDYRTLTSQRNQHIASSNQNPSKNINLVVGRQQQNLSRNMSKVMTTQNYNSLPRSPGGLSYSTQSLDRRHLRDIEFTMPEQVILRPLGHQPFDYLQRPGSSSNLNSSTNNLNTHPANHLSNALRSSKPNDLDKQYRYM